MCEVPDPVPLPETGRVIGIDMGINALITTVNRCRTPVGIVKHKRH
jgi:transposase